MELRRKKYLVHAAKNVFCAVKVLQMTLTFNSYSEVKNDFFSNTYIVHLNQFSRLSSSTVV